ncbi:alanyl-tRNA synthetase [Mesobacillus campisalis]|uniref:Alanine--tRNA ligase n=1 Tax=Mesobacillus campisalis TaxID=1408103 RepID=A0A0M2SL77_9BACI|nr:serine-tRNA(Ala) deacylase AlaX [Mesobacillus campisalis]KKK34411.1 alanyl-tRNA synthetase [Mesobacillus campisalis]
MNHKLYYRDAYLTDFSTKVLNQELEEGNWYVTLEETAFYPTGGGQPHDTGSIEGVSVINVEEVDGEIRHYIDRPLPGAVETVQCTVDWERRFDHMQQHSGQHILSAAFEELYGYRTVSFHLGKETLTIDLDIDELPREHAGAAESRANEIVMDARRIEAKWVNREEASRYPLRKQLSVTEDIRLVIIPEFDYNGCGGTHPKNTAETGLIKILGWERQRKKVRVEFICGHRVLSQLQQKHDLIRELSGLLNAPPEKMPASIQRMIAEGKHMEKTQEDMSEMLLQYEASTLMSDQNPKVLGKVFQNRTMKELQKLAKTIVDHGESRPVLLVAENAEKLQLVCARGENGQLNMKELLGEVLPVINGKGGGKPNFAQGGGEASIPGEDLLSLTIEKMNV